MRISRTSVAVIAVAAVLATGLGTGAIPAIGQDRKPESILPPGFGDPVTPAPAPRAAPTGAPPAIVRPSVPVAVPSGTPLPVTSPTPVATPTPTDPAALVRADMPDYARRSLDRVGVAGPDEGALGPSAFGRADGRYLETLMRRLDAPIASRWLSIALRRTLVSRVDTPSRVNGADFDAERVWLLVRMGEAVAARSMAQAVDAENYTPKLFQAAMQAALATGDPAALCPMAEAGAVAAHERGWVLARAMCAGLSGQPGKAQPLIASARKSGFASGIDLLLAQKVAGTGTSGRQAVTIEWDNVTQLTAWRYGLATATGTDIPDALIQSASPAVQAWRALSPMLDVQSRAIPAEIAAARGVLSSAALVDLYAAIDATDDQSTAEASIARDLHAAYEGADRKTRIEALGRLWDDPKTSLGRYARLILTANAAARLPTDSEDADVDRLVASMLSAGLDRPALRWRDKVARGGDAWAMLALADPAGGSFSYSDVSGYAGKGDNVELKRKLLFAGLAGLGRMPTAEVESGAQSLGIKIGQRNVWTSAIGRAALGRQPGTVVLLAAIGMQTPDWRGVPPEALYHIVLALRKVGMEGEARMIAAEAIARL